MNKNEGYIFGINGPVVHAKGNDRFQMHETVLVGEKRLIGEIIGVDSEAAIVQVYEETTGLKPGEPVISLGKPFSVTLAPGILSNIFDGIERPLKVIKDMSGAFIDRGINISSLDEEKNVGNHAYSETRGQGQRRQHTGDDPGNLSDSA